MTVDDKLDVAVCSAVRKSSLSISKALSWSVWIPLLTFAFTWLIFDTYVQDRAQSGSWGCEMSWMTPSYQQVEVLGSPVPRYGLYMYRERGWDTSVKVSVMLGTAHAKSQPDTQSYSYQEMLDLISRSGL